MRLSECRLALERVEKIFVLLNEISYTDNAFQALLELKKVEAVLRFELEQLENE